MTRFDFLLKTFATHTEQIRAMLDNQQTIVDMLNEAREAERFKRPWVFLTDEEIYELLNGMSLGCCARDVRVVQEKLKDKNNG
jgi:hypothetical protein